MPSFKQNLAYMLTSLLTFTDDVKFWLWWNEYFTHIKNVYFNCDLVLQNRLVVVARLECLERFSMPAQKSAVNVQSSDTTTVSVISFLYGLYNLISRPYRTRLHTDLLCLVVKIFLHIRAHPHKWSSKVSHVATKL